MLKSKVNKWQKAGLMTADQAAVILDHEKQSIGKKYMRALVGLALLAILGGFVLIVASNWYAIGGTTKISAHFLLNVIIAGTVYHGIKIGHFWLREGACFVLYGLTLTLIALIGQVYQLNGTTEEAMLLWTVIASPFVLICGRSRLNALAWTIAFVLTLAYNLEELISSLDMAEKIEENLYLFLLCATPTLLLLTGMNRKFKALRPQWQETYLTTGVVLFIAGGLFSSLAWYDDHFISSLDNFKFAPLLSLAFWGGILLYARDHVPTVKSNTQYRNLALLGILCFGFFFVVAIPGRPESDFMAAIQFIAFAGIIGYQAIQLQNNGLMSFAIILIALRIFIAFIELFGPMMMTGFGMIFAGVVFLLCLWGALKVNKRVKAKLNNDLGASS